MGLTSLLLDFAQRWNLHNAGILTIVTAALSNLVSNVPAVMLLKSLAPGFQDPQHAWLVLAMASTLAGNLTITGSVANCQHLSDEAVNSTTANAMRTRFQPRFSTATVVPLLISIVVHEKGD